MSCSPSENGISAVAGGPGPHPRCGPLGQLPDVRVDAVAQQGDTPAAIDDAVDGTPFAEHPAHNADVNRAPTRKRRRPENSRSATVYPRKRAVAACKSCHARKIKCNNARPTCGSCLASMSPCIYEDRQDISSFDPASILILDQLNQVLTKLDGLPGSSTGEHTAASASSPTPGSRPSAPHHDPETAVTTDEYDGLHMAFQTTPDAILQWPIFENRHPPNHLIDATFAAEMPDEDSDSDESDNPRRHISKLKSGGIDEESILDLVQRFLDLVHIKNPILDHETIWSSAQYVAEEAIGWMALVQISTYITIFFNTFINPIALDAIGWKYYVVFAVILVIITLTVYFFYPETRGHTLEKMAVIFDGADALDVRRRDKNNNG